MHNGRTRVRACVLPPSGCVGIVVGGWGWMALVKRKGPPAVSRHNTRLRKRHSRSAYWWPRGYLPTREQDIYREARETRGVVGHPGFFGSPPAYHFGDVLRRISIAIIYKLLRSHRIGIRGEFNNTYVTDPELQRRGWIFFLASYTFPQIITDTLGARSREIIAKRFFPMRASFNIFGIVKKSRAFKHTVINTRWLYIFRAINLFDATPTFATFIDSPSRHRETGHVIFIKLPDFLGRESVNREWSFSHIIFRMPVAFPHAKWKKGRGERRKPALAKITANESALARAYFVIVESISTRVINVLKMHFVHDIRGSRYQGKFSAEIPATIMSGIYHREITAHFLLFDIVLSLSRYPDNLSVRRMLIRKLSSATAIMAPENADAMPRRKRDRRKISDGKKTGQRLSAWKRSHV